MEFVYSPLGLIPDVTAVTVNPVPDLSGRVTVAILDNSKHGFRPLMDKVQAAVAQRYPEIEWFVERKPGAAHPMADDLRKQILERANLVFTGSGD
ncbi:MAG: hypothetical protein ABS81_10990 [Pseudonocardia sp. SCN 72-86]|nr:MAG: hypothetical protein ABS81_10990 [Pseudonocardia sp. SCN 72-86]